MQSNAAHILWLSCRDVEATDESGERSAIWLNKREREWSAAERRATSLESQVVELQGRLNHALSQLKDAENERDALAKELERVKKELQDQILRNTELSNRARTLNEQLDFQRSLYEKNHLTLTYRKQLNDMINGIQDIARLHKHVASYDKRAPEQ
ncbi:lamin-A-like [Dermacentor albipictus]|uniref:lamin-A-like n=1 Tax=Dermacentor albipictus TaxID=60249 RepID=UPI0038FCB2C0